ncbi:hypothetical protein J2Z75_003843, partial [Rhizobium herbae]|nr:hypothetical protein [Rhizobium herbae]
PDGEFGPKTRELLVLTASVAEPYRWFAHGRLDPVRTTDPLILSIENKA